MALYNFCVIQELIWVNGKLIKNYVGDVIDFKSSTPRYELVLYKFDEENKGKVIFNHFEKLSDANKFKNSIKSPKTEMGLARVLDLMEQVQDSNLIQV